jgi:WD40 repeat protein
MGPLEEYCTLQLCDLSDVPVLCVDISSDGKLMATGSVDGKLRTWDLVFGDIQGVVSAHDHRYCTLIKLNVK